MEKTWNFSVFDLFLRRARRCYNNATSKMEPAFFASSGGKTSFSSGIRPRATPSLSIPLEELVFPARFDKNPRFSSNFYKTFKNDDFVLQ